MVLFWNQVHLNKYKCFNRNFWNICPHFICRKQLDISRIQLEALWEWFNCLRQASLDKGAINKIWRLPQRFVKEYEGKGLSSWEGHVWKHCPFCLCAIMLYCYLNSVENGRRAEGTPHRILSKNTIAHYHWPMPNLSHSSNWTSRTIPSTLYTEHDNLRYRISLGQFGSPCSPQLLMHLFTGTTWDPEKSLT